MKAAATAGDAITKAAATAGDATMKAAATAGDATMKAAATVAAGTVTAGTTVKAAAIARAETAKAGATIASVSVSASGNASAARTKRPARRWRGGETGAPFDHETAGRRRVRPFPVGAIGLDASSQSVFDLSGSPLGRAQPARVEHGRKRRKDRKEQDRHAR